MIWTLSKSILAWGARPMLAQESLMEFHFKNNNEDFVKKMPIHALKVWVHKLVMVVFTLENSRKK
jgi:hypothetical protein